MTGLTPPPSTRGPVDPCHLCRLCLTTLDADESRSLLDDQEVPSLSEKIRTVFGVQINNVKNWPDKICSRCVDNTEQCYSYRTKYKLLDGFLHDTLNQRAAVRAAKESSECANTDSLADSADSSSSGVLPVPHDINIDTRANEMNYLSTFTPHVLTISFNSCDPPKDEEIGSEVNVDNSETVASGTNDLFYSNNGYYKTSNDDKTNGENNKNERDNGSDDQRNGFKGTTSDQYPIVNDKIDYGIKYCHEQSSSTKVVELGDFQKQVIGDKTITSDKEKISNLTPKKMIQVFQFPKKNFTTSELDPQLIQVDRLVDRTDNMDNNNDKLNYLYIPSDNISMLLFAAQLLSTLEGTVEVPEKLVSSDESDECKMKQTEVITNEYSSGHQEQQQVKDINVSPLVTTEQLPASNVPVEKKCTHCGNTYSEVWHRLNNDFVCNACGLHNKQLRGKKRPGLMKCKSEQIKTQKTGN